ncbi:ABC transporter ATP-binding protein [Georgenia sp. Z1344]|uniref:ABC transporter ATP-binding protein n=1 Tax=Georgenia sp. Z1344 TaxID=3416706 RepID=UPI003CF5DD7F
MTAQAARFSTPHADAPADAPPDARAGSPMLTLDGVGKTFGAGNGTGTVALTDVDLTVSPGELVTVVGPSGCGKSTLLRLAAGLDRPTAGTLTTRTDAISYVFQDPTLLEWRTALGNVELAGHLTGVPRAQRRREALAALELVGLAGSEDRYPRELSGGMRMRVSLARALVREPELALFDEPFGALDEITRLTMQTELLRLFTTASFAAVFITHSVSEAAYLSTRVLVMSGRPGRIVADVPVPWGRHRPPELRYEPEFAALTGEISAALGAHA